MQDEVCAYKYAVDTDVIDRTELRKIQYFEMSKEEQSKYKKHNEKSCSHQDPIDPHCTRLYHDDVSKPISPTSPSLLLYLFSPNL